MTYFSMDPTPWSLCSCAMGAHLFVDYSIHAFQDGSSGEDCNKESIERDERRLTELGRRTIEIFVLAQIFR